MHGKVNRPGEAVAVSGSVESSVREGLSTGLYPVVPSGLDFCQTAVYNIFAARGISNAQ